ncbi:RES family NAD+ phosphorylase, partial [Desulfobulbus sp. US4]|nr:RES family NAD+ phosphorylase [Desulfobulbus sp. US4]
CEQRVWAAINNSFSKPLALGNKKFQYIPTQYLAEILKEQGGYDGIIYKSSLHSHGYNIALFDQEKARLIDSKIVEITTLDLGYREVSEPYG